MKWVWSMCVLISLISSSSDMTMEEKRVENALFVMAGEEPPHDVPLDHKEITLHDMLVTSVKAVKESHVGHDPHEEHQGHGDHEDPSHHMEKHDPNAEHQGHGDHGGHMMVMWFHGGCTEVILFDFWRISTSTGLIVSFAIIFAMGALYEGLKWFRLYLTLVKDKNDLKSSPSNVIELTGSRTSNQESNNASEVPLVNANTKTKHPGPFSPMRLFQALLYIVQLVIAYWLMLIVMTYNIWLTIAVILGAGFGHWLFAALRLANPRGETADSIATDACH